MVRTATMFVLCAIIWSPIAMTFAQPLRQETIVIERPEEYQLRILESQIQMLRNKLYAQQRMEDKQKDEWLQHYNEVAKRLEAWNKFSGSYNIQ